MNEQNALKIFFSTLLHEYAETDLDDKAILGYLASLDRLERQSLVVGFLELATMDFEVRADALERLHCAWEFDDPENAFTLLSELTQKVDSLLLKAPQKGV